MNERGQVFTLDMFFALTLTILMVSYSGLAFEQARRSADDYYLRYSLERTASDAADMMLKTLGMPDNWEKAAEDVQIIGLTEDNAGRAVPNTVSITKFGQFRRLINKDNWGAPVNANAVGAIKRLFGGTEKFEVRVLDENDSEMWRAFPRWSPGENSGAENSLDVVTVRRLVSVKYGSAIRADTGPIVKAAGGTSDFELPFNIYPGELDAFDFYIIVVGLSVGQNPPPNLKIWVNDNSQNGDVTEGPDGSADYTFVQSDMPQKIYPNPTEPPVGHFQHGGVENDSEIEAEAQLFVGTN
ncbi:MAG: hypothetical protein AB1744_14370, partial [Candidatus Zixiibacteriota bacterium]